MSLEMPAEIKFWLNFIHPILMWILLGVSIYARNTWAFKYGGQELLVNSRKS